jgi:hypothetical protein
VTPPQDRSSQGAAPSGALTVSIDDAYRVVGVNVFQHDEIRRPESLDLSFRAAYTAAVRARVAERPERPVRAVRPTAVGARLTFTRPTPEMLQRHRIRTESPRTRAPGAPGEVTGASDNDCVHVTLDPAQPIGRIVADPGWLANARLSSIASSITEAFQHAYDRRDH